MEFYAITLHERLSIVEKLQKDLKQKITIFNAIDGSIYSMFDNFTHILKNEKITSGMVGCLLSHLIILRTTSSHITIFEDDCEFIGDKDELNDFINTDFDILCLGTNENVDFEEDYNKVKVTRFWGTHAIMIKRSAISAILQTSEKYYNQKIFLPADWLYSIAIKEYNLKCYAPKNPKQFFQQKIGLTSTINGKVRS